MHSTDAIFECSVDEVLERTAAHTAEFGAGPHAALSAACAAALVTMAARFADWDGARVGELTAARHRLRELADADGPAFEPLLEAWRLPPDAPDREERIVRAARSACAVPVEVCRIGTRLAQVAGELFEGGKPDLAGDAATALYLADAAVASGAHTVRLNAGPADDPKAPELIEETRELAARTGALAAAVRAADRRPS